MPVTRKLISQDNQEDNQIMLVDSLKRYIVNDETEWQFLFGPNSGFTASAQILKLAGEFDTNDFNSIRVVGYLFNTYTGAVDASASAEFKIYKVSTTLNPAWDDQLVDTLSGSVLSNGYYFVDIDINDITGANLDGDTTLMIEGTITRLGRTYRDRIYVNHLGVYDSVTRLKNKVNYLDLTKKDE